MAAAALTVIVLAAAGGPLGLLWHYLSPTVPVINVGDRRIVVNDSSPEEYIAADGWFTLLGLAFGLAAAISAWMLLRRHRGPWLLIAVTLGTLAGAVVAWQAGRLIGRGAYQRWQETSAQAATYQAPPDLHAYGVLLIPAFAAVIALTLMAGWSNDPDLDEPGARPGHGRDLGAGDAPPFSSDWPGGPDPTAAPAPPGPGPAGPPRG
jgi:xanthine/uracil permease